MRTVLLCLVFALFSGCAVTKEPVEGEPVGKGPEGMYRIPMYDSEGNRHWLFLPKHDPEDMVMLPWK